LEPIDFVPEVPDTGRHDRSQSQLSGAYGYEASLARSDSKGSLVRGQQVGMNMSES
jgi:hypothetical protein